MLPCLKTRIFTQQMCSKYLSAWFDLLLLLFFSDGGSELTYRSTTEERWQLHWPHPPSWESSAHSTTCEMPSHPRYRDSPFPHFHRLHQIWAPAGGWLSQVFVVERLSDAHSAWCVCVGWLVCVWRGWFPPRSVRKYLLSSSEQMLLMSGETRCPAESLAKRVLWSTLKFLLFLKKKG